MLSAVNCISVTRILKSLWHTNSLYCWQHQFRWYSVAIQFLFALNRSPFVSIVLLGHCWPWIACVRHRLGLCARWLLAHSSLIAFTDPHRWLIVTWQTPSWPIAWDMPSMQHEDPLGWLMMCNGALTLWLKIDLNCDMQYLSAHESKWNSCLVCDQVNTWLHHVTCWMWLRVRYSSWKRWDEEQMNHSIIHQSQSYQFYSIMWVEEEKGREEN